MTENEMLVLIDTIKGEINRMCVTDKLAELDTMAFYAKQHIEKLRTLLYKERWAERKDDVHAD